MIHMISKHRYFIPKRYLTIWIISEIGTLDYDRVARSRLDLHIRKEERNRV